MRAFAKTHVLTTEASKLPDPQACLQRQCQQRPVPPPGAGRSVRRGDQGLCFDFVEIAQRRVPFALGGDSEHSLDHCGVLGVAQGGKAKERVQAGEAGIAGSNRNVPLGFQVVQEAGDERRVEILDR